MVKRNSKYHLNEGIPFFQLSINPSAYNAFYTMYVEHITLKFHNRQITTAHSDLSITKATYNFLSFISAVSLPTHTQKNICVHITFPTVSRSYFNVFYHWAATNISKTCP